MYVVARDFGFAPNPFHGVCTLATCKPAIRRTAQIGDWIVGMGGSRLRAKGRCIFAMRVSGSPSYDHYWSDPTYRDKRPVRNGSRKMMVGDNIYHHDPKDGTWLQADSHHSQPDGTLNVHNLERDTKTNRVLVSQHFFFWCGCPGSSDPHFGGDWLRQWHRAPGIVSSVMQTAPRLVAPGISVLPQSNCGRSLRLRTQQCALLGSHRSRVITDARRVLLAAAPTTGTRCCILFIGNVIRPLA
jgi:hypothetical protein